MGGDERGLAENPRDVGYDVINSKVEFRLTRGWKRCQGKSP